MSFFSAVALAIGLGFLGAALGDGIATGLKALAHAIRDMEIDP